ncbi:MAG: choice-of-anchor D domain-containing protein, partial [Candidatus Electryoneaceae bacterium]|nr:choice-of-anchor D domain-containing protein [Candidatus Electryoneaceae bacterium]
MTHLIIHNNRASQRGGGLYSTSGAHPTLIHVTIFGNEAEEAGGAVRTYNDESSVAIINSIIWDNNPSEMDQDHLDITYTDVEDGYDGDGNRSSNPRFVDPEEGDYHLQSNSPCIDRGDPDSPDSPDGTQADMGALPFYYSPEIVVEPGMINFGGVHTGLDAERTITITNSGLVPLHVEIVTIVPDDLPFNIVEGGEEVELEPDGEHNVTVRFAPGDTGDFEAILRVVNDDPENEQVDVILIGLGEPPVPVINVEPQALDFGEAVLRMQTERTITITNSGDTILVVTDISFVGEDAGSFSVVGGDFSLIPDQAIEITIVCVSTSLGQNWAELIIANNDPEAEEYDVPLTGRTVLPQPHYEFTDNTGVNHSLLILSVILDNESLAIGNEIAVLTPDGLCCGADLWIGDTLGLAVWGDNEITEEIDGFLEDEEMSFRIWDYVNEEEFVAFPELVRGEGIYRNDGVTVLELSTNPPNGFFLRMSEGWNIISAPIDPDVDSIRAFWRPVVERNNLILLKDFRGRFYSPAHNDFCNLPPWDFRQGYLARLRNADDLLVEGEFVAEDTPIPLQQNWN